MTANPANRILLAVSGWDPSDWVTEFARHAPEREVVLEPDGADDPTIRYAVAWKQPAGMLAELPNLEAIFSIGAGVDHILRDDSLPDVPIVRIVADDLTMRMSEYIVWQVLDQFRQGRLYRDQQARKIWRECPQMAASAVTVGVMGLGVLGTDAAAKLAALGFNLTGWSRQTKHVEGVKCFAGEAALGEFLGASDIVVVLLPLTEQTRGIINRQMLSKMKPSTPLGGPILINAGRGGLQVEADILEALDNETLMAASLDVFEIEPLPKESRLWDHPGVTVTPHAAAISDATRLVPQMLEQMADHERGRPLTNLVDRKAGY